MKHDLTLLAKLLNRTQDEILSDSLTCYVKHVLKPELRTVYTNFIEAIALTAPEEEQSLPKRYRLSPKVAGMSFNPDKTRGGIISALSKRINFTREEFRQVVSEVMSWKPATRSFGIKTKFPSLDDADRAWFGTLKSRDRLIEESD